MCRSIDGAKVRHVRRGSKFSGPKTGVFFKTYAFFLWPVFVACFWDPEQRNREQITVEQKLKCRITAEQGTDNSGTGKKIARAAEQGTDNSGTEIKVPEESAQDFI